MSERNVIYENFHTKRRVHSARCTNAFINQLHIMMNIQPENKRERERTRTLKLYFTRCVGEVQSKSRLTTSSC